MSHEFNLVPWVADVNPQFLMEFSDCRLFGCLRRFHLPARERKLTSVESPLCTLNQQHLAVIRVNIARRQSG